MPVTLNEGRNNPQPFLTRCIVGEMGTAFHSQLAATYEVTVTRQTIRNVGLTLTALASCN